MLFAELKPLLAKLVPMECQFWKPTRSLAARVSRRDLFGYSAAVAVALPTLTFQRSPECGHRLTFRASDCGRRRRDRWSWLRVPPLDPVRKTCRCLRVQLGAGWADPDPSQLLCRRSADRRACGVHQSRTHDHPCACPELRTHSGRYGCLPAGHSPQPRATQLLRATLVTRGPQSGLA